MKHPIDAVEWKEAELLIANEYNPNVVYTAEMKLLELSIVQTGWIQPVLISQDNIIIDGFHRVTLTKVSQAIREKYGSKVPCCVLLLNEAERMLLTIRINRAKGSHIAYRMGDVIKKLILDIGLQKEYVANQIGASKDEVDLLLQHDVFEKLQIATHKYSKAWYPK